MKELAESLSKYIEKFGTGPVIIGMFWNAPDQLKKNLDKAVSSGVPYDEYKLLTLPQREAFDAGKLLF